MARSRRATAGPSTLASAKVQKPRARPRHPPASTPARGNIGNLFVTHEHGSTTLNRDFTSDQCELGRCSNSECAAPYLRQEAVIVTAPGTNISWAGWNVTLGSTATPTFAMAGPRRF